VATVEEEVGQRIGLERGMQAALRIEIDQLDPATRAGGLLLLWGGLA
jgi:hypothetical protein